MRIQATLSWHVEKCGYNRCFTCCHVEAWEPSYPVSTNSLVTSQTTSQTSLISSSGTRDHPLFGRSKVRVSPAATNEEVDGTSSSSVISRVDTPDVFINDRVTVEEATGETVMDKDNPVISRLEVPHCIEHHPYIPLETAQKAIARVKEENIADAIVTV